jgi:RimJ/RimL family protein N-acetyltransferase
MTKVQLVRLEPALEEAIAHHPQYMEALARGNWTEVADIVHGVVGRTLATQPISVDELHWDGYFVVDEETRELVGSCAFKAPPTADGVVEIAYFTYPSFEGRGYATQMARALVVLARRDPAIREVIAHTLPELNASSRVLAKIGMQCMGEVVDPEDGPVWRWQLSLGA